MRIAGTMMCFDRPHYLESVLKSFEEADEAHEIDWFMFQDGAVNEFSEVRYAEDGDLEDVASLIRNTSLPVKEFFRQEYNVSPAQQRYLMYQVLQDYDLVYVFDDDMVIGQHYFSLLRKMALQYPNYVGLLFATGRIPVNKESLRKLRTVRIARLWGHYMTRKNWLKFEDDHRIYYNHMKTRDYFIYMKRGGRRKDPLPERIPTGMDDCIVNHLCRRNGVEKLVPHISRAKYIGKYGNISYKLDKYWIKKGMANQREKITFPSDANLKRFNF